MAQEFYPTQKKALFSSELLKISLKEALYKFHPRLQWKNPVMLLVNLGALLTSIAALQELISGQAWGFSLQIAIWLWFTAYFSNFAEAVAEGRGKAQAESLRKMRSETKARLLRNGVESQVPASSLRKGDRVICEAGDVIPGDGEVIEGIASVDESAITGESAPVVRESGGDRSAVTGGTRVISDRIIVNITQEPGQSFIEQMIGLVEGASRQRTPNEIALNILLLTLTIVFVLAVTTLKAFAIYSEKAAGFSGASPVSLTVLVALLVCLIPTTIAALLSAIGISGMDRLLQRNVLATSGKAVEVAGDVDVLLLDKTGTITHGNRMASAFYPVSGSTSEELVKAALLASLADETPEGRSIVALASEKFGLELEKTNASEFVPFSAQTRMSGLNRYSSNISSEVLPIRKGAADAVIRWVRGEGGIVPVDLQAAVETIARKGSTPLVVSEGSKILGLIELKDVVKTGIRERFEQLRRMGIRTIMITGDNPLTAAAIAAEAGVDDYLAEATPEAKLARIRAEQGKGHLVAMVGDGTNDAPALAQADIGVAMASGTQAAREAGNMVDLDSNPTKLIEVVEIGKQLLMTRGALTTFSIANDLAKYFAILPALFAGLYAGPDGKGPLAALNIMGLATPQSAILSAVIFNALIIIVLIPLALKGISYRPQGALVILRKNILIYGLGGVFAPFLGIKLIDMLLLLFHLV